MNKSSILKVWIETAWKQVGCIPLLVCLVTGLAIAILPHFLWWEANGGPTWIASDDEMGAYLTVAAQAFHDHPHRLADPALAAGGDSMFPAIQILPGVWLAKLLCLGPGGITLGWRLIAGVMMPLGYYLLCRLCLSRAWMAAAVTVVMLLDHGIIAGRLLDRHFLVWATLLRSETGSHWFGSWPVLLHQWRVITPSLSLAFLWLHVFLLLRATQNPTRQRIIAAGAAFGLLFWVYFYYWTAAGVALALVWLVRPEARGVCFNVGWIGGLIGLPSVVASSAMKREFGVDWLQRANKFIPVERGEGFILPPVAVGLVLLGTVWCWWRRRDLLPLAALAISGLLLCNQSAVSGLQMEDNHWNYVWMPSSCLLLGLLAASEIEHHVTMTRPVAAALVVGVALHASVGVTLRVWEVTRSRHTIRLNDSWERYEAQRAVRVHDLFRSREVVAGMNDYVDCAVVSDNLRSLAGASQWFSPNVRDAELARRRALNAWLLGKSSDQVRRELVQAGELSSERNPPAHSNAARAEAMLMALEEVSADPTRWLQVFQVRYLALPINSPPPSLQSHKWKKIQGGPSWDVWVLE